MIPFQIYKSYLSTFKTFLKVANYQGTVFISQYISVFILCFLRNLRWHGTPMDDAKRGGHTEIVAMLNEYDARMNELNDGLADLVSAKLAVQTNKMLDSDEEKTNTSENERVLWIIDSGRNSPSPSSD